MEATQLNKSLLISHHCCQRNMQSVRAMQAGSVRCVRERDVGRRRRGAERKFNLLSIEDRARSQARDDGTSCLGIRWFSISLPCSHIAHAVFLIDGPSGMIHFYWSGLNAAHLMISHIAAAVMVQRVCVWRAVVRHRSTVQREAGRLHRL